MTESFLKSLDDGLEELKLPLTEQQKELLFRYYKMVVEKNQVMNLTAITEEGEFVTKHLLDSLALVCAGEPVRRLLEAGEIDLIDVGTGAGLPGVVLKIAFPKLRVTLFDSLQKRLRFLDEVIKELSLKEIHTLHGRAEEIGQKAEYREQFDLVTSRAVANLATLSEYCLPLLKPNGLFLPYKAGDIAEELDASQKAIKLLGGTLCAVENYTLPQTEINRSLLLIKKTKRTPKTYPRKAGTPAKDPLH